MYYGIAGRNGFGIFDDYDRLEKAQEYVYDALVKEDADKFKAYEFARDTYNSFYEGEDFDKYFYGKFTDLKMNRFLFKKQIVKMNQRDAS